MLPKEAYIRFQTAQVFSSLTGSGRTEVVMWAIWLEFGLNQNPARSGAWGTPAFRLSNCQFAKNCAAPQNGTRLEITCALWTTRRDGLQRAWGVAHPRRVRRRAVSSPKTSCGDFPNARMICSTRVSVADCSPMINR